MRCARRYSGASNFLTRCPVQHSRFLFVAGVSLLAACSDSGGPSGQSGSLAFTYSGGVSGSYSATGNVPANQAQFNTSTWAVGSRDEPNQSLLIESVATRAGARYDLVFLQIDRLVTGSSAVDLNCDPDIVDACTGLVVFFGVSTLDDNAQFLCGLETGQVTITSITDTRAQGTFSGSGFCTDENFVESAFTLSGGTFDVPLITNLPT
jgi:hypothetical protein